MCMSKKYTKNIGEYRPRSDFLYLDAVLVSRNKTFVHSNFLFLISICDKNDNFKQNSKNKTNPQNKNLCEYRP